VTVADQHTHAYGNVKGARAVPQMKGTSLGRPKTPSDMTAPSPAGHVVAQPMTIRQVTKRTMGTRRT
jgi:hypothetical protein